MLQWQCRRIHDANASRDRLMKKPEGQQPSAAHTEVSGINQHSYIFRFQHILQFLLLQQVGDALCGGDHADKPIGV